MERPLALVVDGDPAVRAMIRDVLEEHDLTVLTAGNERQALELLKSRAVGMLIMDRHVADAEGLELHSRERDLRKAPILVSLVSSGDETEATRLVRAGAFDVLAKPLDEQALQQLALRLIAQYETLDTLRRLREELQAREGYQGLVGRSSVMERLRERLRQLGPTTACVWFVGESGTGKKLAARTLHGLSATGEGPFIVVPCAELTENAWSERWHGEGGWLNQAAGGTLYLEELTDLPMDLQERLKSTLASRSAIRLLASSSSDPTEAAEQGQLLEELRRFLGGEELVIPALRDRAEDIPLLARHFISTVCEINHLPTMRLTPEALGLLERAHWPQNVRELRNAIEQAVILSTDGTITPRELGETVIGSATQKTAPAASATEALSLREFRDAKRRVVEAFEQSYLRELMERHGGNVTAASHQAGMLRSALQRLLRKYGLKSAEFRERRRAAQAAETANRPTVD